MSGMESQRQPLGVSLPALVAVGCQAYFFYSVARFDWHWDRLDLALLAGAAFQLARPLWHDARALRHNLWVFPAERREEIAALERRQRRRAARLYLQQK